MPRNSKSTSIRVNPQQTPALNVQLDPKEFSMWRRERLAYLQALNRGSRSGAVRKSLRQKRRSRVKSTTPNSTPGLSSFVALPSAPSTPAFMPREKTSPPPAPRASKNRVIDLGTPTPPPRRSRVIDHNFLTVGSLFHIRSSPDIILEDMTEDESDAWHENMRDAFEGANKIRKAKPSQSF
ncbi:uncharacterized protein BT62DRAFT_931297 [Guyanagaster necrorhizus]|uniref:Uncharacterized protein n=1 Tax=Guyanagaster necrorhizus TaxID=856835 RepID=A0A9P7VUB6_9AGAR|nr:uncharacterized protein BT62DRAFT_931297 [Guyanagaster necrorhizus MCA 3950]KAG7446727.1 hypothetical protein BT62DRAFT_931297 [Guyanagaster necrorhizus MCA 3950]